MDHVFKWCVYLVMGVLVGGMMPCVGFAEDSVSTQIEALKLQLNAQADQLHQLQLQTKSTPPTFTLGGYGEIGYNLYRTDSSRNQVDLKRFVIFLGHQFNDRLSFSSELEWEHAVTSATDKGESEIEQAYLAYQFTSGITLKTGLFLMPFGVLNESHEPPVFYGVERNEVETRIIPSTWREGGVGLKGTTDTGLAWEVGITTGFDLAKLDDASAPLRASHQELQFAKASDLAYYGALNYRNSGWLVGGALFTGNAFQSNADFKADGTLPDFAGIAGQITLWDVHTRWQGNGWDFQAIYANGSVGDSDKIDAILKAYNTANSTSRPYIPSQFYGWLIQGAYTVWQADEMSLAPFLRYEKYNTQANMPGGFDADPANANQVITLGVSFKPHSEVVFKADYQKFQDTPSNDRFNLGMGYLF